MKALEYWNEIGSKKDFEDPVYLGKLSSFLSPTSKIIEYGCGYGRLLRILKSKGYQHLLGFDFAPNMIARGYQENPDLDLSLLEKSGEIPCSDESIDAVMMSTVLCCMIDAEEQTRLMVEILRILKKGGILYITDFLVCEHSKYQEKYERGIQEFGVRGIYTTNENVAVCHYTSQAIMNLLHAFDIQWFEQFDFKTMNQNPARTFHCIAGKSH